MRTLTQRIGDNLIVLMQSSIKGLSLIDEMQSENRISFEKRLLLADLKDLKDSCEWSLQIAREMEREIHDSPERPKSKHRRKILGPRS